MEECCGHKEDNCCGEDSAYCEMTGSMMQLADMAWGDLMREKMKALWEKQRGANMDKVAELVIAHSMASWTHKMQKQDMQAELPKEEIEKFKKELAQAMNQ